VYFVTAADALQAFHRRGPPASLRFWLRVQFASPEQGELPELRVLPGFHEQPGLGVLPGVHEQPELHEWLGQGELPERGVLPGLHELLGFHEQPGLRESPEQDGLPEPHVPAFPLVLRLMQAPLPEVLPEQDAYSTPDDLALPSADQGAPVFALASRWTRGQPPAQNSPAVTLPVDAEPPSDAPRDAVPRPLACCMPPPPGFHDLPMQNQLDSIALAAELLFASA
jgi:hypothetical protein